MTSEEEAIMEDFRKWDPTPPTIDQAMLRTWSAKVPDGYERVPGPWFIAWDLSDIGIDGPPLTAVPCKTCGEDSQPHARCEFEYEGAASVANKRGWHVGISLFVYICPEHGFFVNEAQERGYNDDRPRNGHRMTIS